MEHPTHPGTRLLTLVVPACYVALGTLMLHSWLGGFLFGATIAFAHRVLLTTLWWSNHHRRGMRELRAHRPEWALQHFRDAEGFYELHPWLDEQRALVLMSPLAYPHVVVARYHQALCLLWNGRATDATMILELIERRYPDFEAARELLGTARGRQDSPQTPPGFELDLEGPTQDPDEGAPPAT